MISLRGMWRRRRQWRWLLSDAVHDFMVWLRGPSDGPPFAF